MANVQIKNVPEDIHAELRRRAELEGMTVRDYLLRLIKRDQERMSGVEWERKLLELEPVHIPQSAADGIAEDRAEREANFDRIEAELAAERTRKPGQRSA